MEIGQEIRDANVDEVVFGIEHDHEGNETKCIFVDMLNGQRILIDRTITHLIAVAAWAYLEEDEVTVEER